MKFKEYFKEPQFFTNREYVLDAKYSEKDALELFEAEAGCECEKSRLKKDRVRFGFPPCEVEESEDMEGPCWYTGAYGKGSKEVWTIVP